MPRVTALVEMRFVSEAAEMITEHEARHGLEHGNVDALAAPGTVAMYETRTNCADGGQAHDAVDQRVRHITRRAVGRLRHQRRQSRRSLDQIVISRFRGIGPVLA